MKITKSITILAFSVLLIVSCKKADNEISSTKEAIKVNKIADNAKLATATFNIEGMTCAEGCAKMIEKELSATSGVKTAAVNFDGKTATVEYDTNVQSPEKIVTIVEKAGNGKTYKVSNVKNSQDKAMLYDQEDPKKSSSKKKSENTTYIASGATTTNVATEKTTAKPSCCAAKKQCSADEKKGNL